MAVYTQLTEEHIRDFLARFDLGAYQRHEGITQGVENTNYHLYTSAGRFILTLIEKRTPPGDLPFIFAFMKHLSGADLSVPGVLAQGSVNGKPAVVLEFLQGCDVREDVITPDHCAQVGTLLANMHLAAESFLQARENPVGQKQWEEMFEALKGKVDPLLEAAIAGALADCACHDGRDLPRGAVHADLFPDNVFFEDGVLTGVIDFYFSCTAAFAYDLAVTVNAWCFDKNGALIPERARAMLAAYEAIRPLSGEEKQDFPRLRRAAALRFLMTRLYDWVFTPPDAAVNKKDPMEYFEKMKADFAWP